MKLPISLLVLAALSQALSVPVTKRSEVNTSEAKTTAAKTSETNTTMAKTTEAKATVAKSIEAKDSAAKSSGAKQKDNNQTNKRALFEGNFGERNEEIVSKHGLKGRPANNAFAKEWQDIISDQTPAHQMFGVRLPQIAKISDVLSGHGPSFEAAVAKQLYSPVSVYQTILTLPTSFEVATPATSESSYSNPKAYRLRNAGRGEQKLQLVPPKSVKIPKPVELANPPLPLYMVNEPRLRFDSHPQALDSGLAHRHESLPEELFRPQEVPRKHMPLLFPLYNQLGHLRYPGQVVPSQYSQRHGIFHISPVAHDFDKSYQEGNRGKNYPSEVIFDVKYASPKLQIDIPVNNQGYHAHPNGAISFARFTHNLHDSMQYDTAAQPQAETFHQPQPAQYRSQAIPVQLPTQIQPELMMQSQEQNEAPVNQKLPFPPMLQGLIQDLEKYQPVYQQQPQFNSFNQQIQYQPRTLNALQQHLLLQEPRQSSNLQTVQLQRLPAFKPLHQSLLTPESYFKKASRSPITSGQSSKPFIYNEQSENHDLSLGQASAQLNSLPPLKPNYSKYVKPLELNTTQFFLPMPFQTLSTSTAKVEPVFDQLISSTTIQPDVKGQENRKTQSIQEETESQSQTPQPLKPQVFHQSQLTVQPPSVQSTTYLPFVTNEPQSKFFKYSTPQPTYQSTSRPTPQRHDVVIQRQEIQEIFFEPTSSTPRYRNEPALVFSPKQELHQLRTQHPHYQLFEQLLPYKQEYQDIHSPQEYIVEARESQQKPVSAQQGKPQQYVIQQHSNPFQQSQQQLLQNQQPELEQSQQQQRELNQAQQQQEPDQAHQKQQETLEKAQQQQQVFERAQQKEQQRLNQAQQQQESEQAYQQQQQALEQAQQQQTLEQVQQQALEQAQQQALEQAQPQAFEKTQQQQTQQQQQESEQALQQQYQQNSLESSNQIQISTVTPPQDTEKQTETVEIQQQRESQTELQQDSKLQSSTGKPDEQPEHLLEPTPHLQQPYLGPFLTPSVVPQLYAHQQLVAQADHSPLLGAPSYSDVQYFGKFAETLFGNQKHHH